MGELVARNPSIIISRASTAWKYLHGLINVYKPANMPTFTVIKAIKTNICNDLNSMELDEPKPLVQINSSDNKKYEIELVPNMGQDILATGRRYTEDMLRIATANHLGVHCSGVLIIGVNRSIPLALRIRNGAPIQTFHNVLRSMHECQQIWKEHPDMVNEEISTPVGYEQNEPKT